MKPPMSSVEKMVQDTLFKQAPQPLTVNVQGPDGAQNVPVEVAQAMFLAQIAQNLGIIANVLVSQYATPETTAAPDYLPDDEGGHDPRLGEALVFVPKVVGSWAEGK